MTRDDAIRISRLHQIFTEEQLSDHQRDIAVMYFVGSTIDEIADEKGIKPDSVRKHLNVVRRTLGSTSLPGIRTIALLRALTILLSDKL